MAGFLSTRDVTRGEVLRYLFLPQVLPRLNAFYKTGFAQLAYMIALVYRAANILPAGHPVLLAGRAGGVTLRDVLAAAAAELKYDRKHIDKVIIYFLILLGLFLLVGQFFLTLAFLLSNPAFAAAAPSGTMPTNYGEFFAAPAAASQNQPMRDVAYQMLFSVFGVPELFNPGASNTTFHTALHSLFQLYSIGLLVVAVIIACYFVFAIIVETAQTGVPFGKRYNHVWTPIRLVFALGLLIPMGYGLNAAQWITLYAAKFGSDFANRGWIIFNDRMNAAFLENPEERVARPNIPEVTRLASYMMLVSGCKFAYEEVYRSSGSGGGGAAEIQGWLVKNPGESADGGAMPLANTTFQQAMEFFNNGDIIIRFGQRDPQRYTKEPGNVYPFCGDLVVLSGDTTEPGALAVQEGYFRLIWQMYRSSNYKLQEAGENFVRKYITIRGVSDPNAQLPDPSFKATVADRARTDLDQIIQQAVTQQAQSGTWTAQMGNMTSYGWAGAGLWYNRIAQINGSFVTAVNNVPEARRLPEVLEHIKRRQLVQNVRVPQVFSTNLAGTTEMEFDSPPAQAIGTALTEIQGYWNREDGDQSRLGNQTRSTNNIFIDTVNLIFGTRGLFNMCANSDVHPLAQLSALGKGLIEASIRNLAIGFGAGGISQILSGHLAAISGAASSILLSIATTTVTLGFMLFYVVPFMPFLYFFLAVGGWIKGLFEAMVGVPLWALAHLRIDGEGLPGDAAMDGYYLIFEIFLRPILILFGLLASVVIFAAMVKVLNEIFYLVVTNLSGHNENFRQLCGRIGSPGPGGGNDAATTFFRGPIDELFYTVIYAIIVYMIGNSCFKLIDLVPNNLLRYLGSRVSTFSDAQTNAAEGLMSRMSIGSSQITGSVINSTQSGIQSIGQAAKGFSSLASGDKK